MKKFVSVILTVLVFVLIFLGSSHYATRHKVEQALNRYSQDATKYINFKQLVTLSQQRQKQLATDYLTHYFSPWNESISQTSLQIIQAAQQKELAAFKKNSGVGLNDQRYSREWLANLNKNANLATFPNLNVKAITIYDSQIRILPTFDPSYKMLHSDSDGYPFDNLQESFIALGTPLQIVHTSSDHLWYYVIGASYSGWIAAHDVAPISSNFRATWQTQHYLITSNNNVVLDQKIIARMGVLYPVINKTKHGRQILLPVIDASGWARLKSVPVNQDNFNSFPLPFSETAIASIANHMIGNPYGWGGIYGYRDCSSTTQDLFGLFGIWLPRHSSDQGKVGKYISLKNFSDKDKQKIILKNAVPFLTLIHIPGHIVLYLGEKKGLPMVYQNLWGLHIYNFFGHNRVIIGKTIISPLNFGKQFINSNFNHLSAADGMVILNSAPTVSNGSRHYENVLYNLK